MGINVVQVSLNDGELKELSDLAKGKGLSLPLYIKSQIFDIKTDDYLDELKQLVAAFATGWFNIKQLFGVQRWGGIEKSKKLILGKVFYNEVVQGNVTMVRAAGKDSANTQWYYKSVDKKYYEQKVPDKLIEEIERFMALPVAEIDKMKAFEYVTKLSSAFGEGLQEFDAEVKKITEKAQERINNGEWHDLVVSQANRQLDRIKLAQNGYAVKLFDQLMELAERGRRS